MKKKSIFVLTALSALMLTACAAADTVNADISDTAQVTAAEISSVTDKASDIFTETVDTDPISFTEESIVSENIQAESSCSISEPTEHICYADEGHVKISGRTVFENNIRYLGYTCSSAEFSFCGTYADLELIPEPLEFDSNESSYYSVTVNSEEIFRGLLGEKTIFCAVDADKGSEYTVKITKLSEGCFGAVGIGRIKTVSYDDIKPTESSQHRIEFIGDSLTCGYGVEALGAEEAFSTSTENGMKGYASLTAERLGFDYNIIGMNGIGVVSRYTANGEKRTDDFLMPELYRYTDAFRSDELWDSQRFPADICVIALGANDNSYTCGIKAREDEFEAGYIELIKQVRYSAPNAYILCVSGIQRSNLYDVISDAADKYAAESNDGNISSFRFNSQKDSEGYGSDYHPSAVSQQRFSDELYSEIIRIFPEYKNEQKGGIL